MRRTVAEQSRTMSGQDTDMSVTAKYVNKPKSTELKFDTKSYGHIGWLLPVMSCGVTLTHLRTHALAHSRTHTLSDCLSHTLTHYSLTHSLSLPHTHATTHDSQFTANNIRPDSKTDRKEDQTVRQTEKILSTVP